MADAWRWSGRVWYDDDWKKRPEAGGNSRGRKSPLGRQREADSRAEIGTEVEIDCGSKVEVEGAEGAAARWSVSHGSEG